MKYVYGSKNVVRRSMLEKARYPGKETGLLWIGRKQGDNFYFRDATDSGPCSSHEWGMFQRDGEYCDWLASHFTEAYAIPEEEIVYAQVHSHPDGVTRFSGGDKPGNIRFSRQFQGTVMGLINTDPDFRLQFWYIDPRTGQEEPCKLNVNDKVVQSMIPLRSMEELATQIREQEHPELFFDTMFDDLYHARKTPASAGRNWLFFNVRSSADYKTLYRMWEKMLEEIQTCSARIPIHICKPTRNHKVRFWVEKDHSRLEWDVDIDQDKLLIKTENGITTYNPGVIKGLIGCDIRQEGCEL